jgi:hypothetical protein
MSLVVVDVQKRGHVPVFVVPVRASCCDGVVIVARTVFYIDLYNEDDMPTEVEKYAFCSKKILR